TCSRGPDPPDAGGAACAFRLDFDRKIQKNETTQPIEVMPRSRIQRGPSGLFCLAVYSTGAHISKTSEPSAMQLATANLTGFFKIAGAFRSGPRKMPINTNAASHSIGVLSNHS